jgi:Fe-S-cluster containining protein
MGAPAGKEAIWLTCKQKSCCHATIVLTGRDVWRIARGLGVPPRSFVMVFASPVARRDAFALDQSERRFRLALAHQPSKRKVTASPCIFLLRTRQRHHRCALGPLRPMLCQSFPSQVTDGILSLQTADCTCGKWNLADLDMAAERAQVGTQQDEAEEYCQIVSAWNAQIPPGRDDPQAAFGAFCDYLLSTYDHLARTGVPGSSADG